MAKIGGTVSSRRTILIPLGTLQGFSLPLELASTGNTSCQIAAFATTNNKQLDSLFNSDLEKQVVASYDFSPFLGGCGVVGLLRHFRNYAKSKFKWSLNSGP